MSTELHEIIANQNQPLQAPTPFATQKLIKEASKNWDLFYKRNTTNFFKDRHWPLTEFPELMAPGTMLELGCGVGNCLFPILESNPNLMIKCTDFSPRAIEFVKAHAAFDCGRIHAFVSDLTKDSLRTFIEPVDIITAIFCLSAIPPFKIRDVLLNVKSVLKPCGIVLIRDYALFDSAQLRFGPSNRIDDGWYTRTDGTFSVFFSVQGLKDAFEEIGFETIECGIVTKEVVNRKQGIEMSRVFVQGKFRMPEKELDDEMEI